MTAYDYLAILHPKRGVLLPFGGSGVDVDTGRDCDVTRQAVLDIRFRNTKLRNDTDIFGRGLGEQLGVEEPVSAD
mgnify:CR=1 FL=1